MSDIVSENLNKLANNSNIHLGNSHGLVNAKFSINGGLLVENLDVLGLSGEYLHKRKVRYTKKESTKLIQYNTRDPRYIMAIDPAIEFPQKLEAYMEDIFDAVEFISHAQITNINNQILELSPMFDYLKNVILTIFNSFTQR